MELKNIVVLYHAQCLDGMGGAYAAWKKFGETASYIGVYHGEPPPEGLEGKEAYIVDFSYPGGQLIELEKKAKKLVVLDHHAGAREYVEAVKEHIFDDDRSGAGIAWEYFNPGTPLPRLLAYIQDNDLWQHALPHAETVGAYLGIVSLSLETFEMLKQKFEDDSEFKKIKERGEAYAEYADHLCAQLAAQAEQVEFEGYRVRAVNSGRALHSQLGNMLAERYPPLSIVWYRHHGMWHFSLRGVGKVDLSKLAQKYGGNGHFNAAGFTLPFSSPLPFTFFIHESTGD